MLTAATVHTTGINWESVAVIAGIVVGLMSTVLGFFAKLIGNQITAAINKFRVDVIGLLENRMTAMESRQANRKR